MKNTGFDAGPCPYALRGRSSVPGKISVGQPGHVAVCRQLPEDLRRLFVDPRVSIAPTTPILLMDLGFGETVAPLRRAFVFNRDLGFVAW